MAESFVDSFKTELIADRVWRTRTQLELATVEWVGWFNNTRLHESLGDLPPVEFEALHAASEARNGPIPDNRSVTALPPRAPERLTTALVQPVALTGVTVQVAGSQGSRAARAVSALTMGCWFLPAVLR